MHHLINNRFLVLVCTFALSVCCLKLYVISYLTKVLSFSVLPLFRWAFSGLFTDGGGSKKAPLPKICHTYPTMMKLGTVISYLKKIQKYMNHVTHHLRFADISIFSTDVSKFCYIKKYIYRLHFDT